MEMNAHLLLKFQYLKHLPDGADLVTHAEHLKVIKESGRVWWGTNRSTISQGRAESLRSQLVAEIPTYVFLYGTAVPTKVSPDHVTWFRARLRDLSLGKPSDLKLIPEYYRNEEPDDFYVQLSDFEEIKFPLGKTLKVPGQAAIRHVSFEGTPDPQNLVGLDKPDYKICNLKQHANDSDARANRNAVAAPPQDEQGDASELIREASSPTPSFEQATKIIELQEELIQLKNQNEDLRTYKEYYNKILTTDYLFSSEKFLETWLQDNIHRIFPEIEILDRQPTISWPDGKFGRLDLS